MKSAIAVLVVIVAITSGRCFEMPEPVFEVFEPRGLRVSIPDGDGIKSVRFLFAAKHDKETILQGDGERTEQHRWMYWNPEAILQKGDEIHYEISVEVDDVEWTREGKFVVDEVHSLRGEATATHEPEVKPGRVFSSRRGLRGLISEGKKTSYQSSYSSYQNQNEKPITRSLTSSATGTFLMKPNGEIEASGYKKSESYDSTKREGEQWEMSESEMTQEELDELKRFIGPGFRSIGDLTRGQVEEFRRLHGTNFHLPRNEHQGVRSYEQSYFSKQSSSSVSNQDQSAMNQNHYQTHLPLYSPYQPHNPPPSANRYEEHYSRQSSTGVVKPHFPSQQHEDSRSRSSHSYEYTRGESHRVMPPHPTDPSPSYLTEIQEERRRHRDSVHVTPNPIYATDSAGSIFTSVTQERANRPQECLARSQYYIHGASLRDVERKLEEVSCLALLGENVVKQELANLRQQNENLLRRLDTIERDFRNYQNACKCSG